MLAKPCNTLNFSLKYALVLLMTITSTLAAILKPLAYDI